MTSLKPLTSIVNTNSTESNEEILVNTSSATKVLKPTNYSSALESNSGTDCYGDERQALADQRKFFNNQLFSDITLIVENKKYLCHKLILVKSSDVFERMFSLDWDKFQQKEIELHEDSRCADIFPSFLKFFYDSHVRLDIYNTLSMLMLSDKYNVQDLTNICIKFASTSIIPHHPLKDIFHVWFVYAIRFNHKKLVQCCIEVLSKKMEDIMTSVEWKQEWLTIERDQLIELLKSSKLIIKDEYELWKAVLEWLQFPEDSGRVKNICSNVKAVIKHIRFPMMFPSQLCQLESNKIVQDMLDIFQPYLLQAYKSYSLSLSCKTRMTEFTSSGFLLRNYTSVRMDKRMVINDFSKCKNEVKFSFTTLEPTFSREPWNWNLILCPHTEKFKITLNSRDQYSGLHFEYLLSLVNQETIFHSTSGQNIFHNIPVVLLNIDIPIFDNYLSQFNCSPLTDDKLVFQIVLRPI